ncbi:MAG TPA: Rieske (2Fe-2S) protein [Vicinamibacterales bacterium]|jgi:Rieske Fe-S protein
MSNAFTFVSRRQFCAGACQAASCATLATLVSACGGSPTGPSDRPTTLPTLSGQFSSSTSTVNVTTTGTALDNLGGAALVQSEAGVFLISKTTATTFTAIDAVCTHEGCTVTGATDTEYVCPCHGSRYDRSGHVTHGPAQANLRQYANSFAGGVVTINL